MDDSDSSSETDGCGNMWAPEVNDLRGIPLSFAELLGIRLSCLAIRSWPVRIEGSIVGT